MKRWFLGLLITCLLVLPNPAPAAVSYEVRSGILVSFPTLPSHWFVSKEPPEFLVKEHAGHLSGAQMSAARNAGISPEEVARKKLGANDLFLYNPQTGAHLMIDFSPLREGESPPRSRTLKRSARFAAEGLQDEEGIEAAKSRVVKSRINGAKTAYRMDADFLKHGEATRFIGIVTFALDHWVYLYYTAPQSAQEDLEVVNRIFSHFAITPGQQ